MWSIVAWRIEQRDNENEIKNDCEDGPRDSDEERVKPTDLPAFSEADVSKRGSN